MATKALNLGSFGAVWKHMLHRGSRHGLLVSTGRRVAASMNGGCFSQQRRCLAVGGGPEFGDKGQVPEEEPDLWPGDGRDRAKMGKSPQRAKRKWLRGDPFEEMRKVGYHPDPDLPPDGYFKGQIPEEYKLKMFELYQQDPVKYSAKTLAKMYGIRRFEAQVILTFKQRIQWHLKNTPGYEVYPDVEECVTEDNEELMEELSIDYGVEIPYYYKPAGEIDFEDPENWIGSGGTGRDHRVHVLEEEDPNDLCDVPPLRTQQEMVDDIQSYRAKRAKFKADRQAAADAVTEKLKTTKRFPKKRWAYVMKDIMSERTKKEPPICRDPAGKLRGLDANEEKALSWAPKEYFRRNVGRRKSMLLDMD